MEKRKMENLGVSVSLLGYGCMRFPTLPDGKIDRAAAEELLDRAIKSGVNYFDTAYPYHNGESEPFVGDAMSKYPRSSFFLATKMPPWAVNTKEDIPALFEKQLERLKTDYIDFYLLHAMDAEKWKKMKGLGAVEYLENRQREGKIRFLGFSFHDSYEVFEEILNSRSWDFCQIQLNYMDAGEQAGVKGLELAEKKGIPVVVMEPVKGGLLAKLPADISASLSAVTPGRSDASWAMRYVASFPNVKVILSGMSDMTQLEDNINTFSPFSPLTPDERKALERAVATMRSRIKNPCTGCGYCMPCPNGVEIPRNFRVWNSFGVYGNSGVAGSAYREIKEGARADACIGCGECLDKCPQKIDIPSDLARMKDDAEEWK